MHHSFGLARAIHGIHVDLPTLRLPRPDRRSMRWASIRRYGTSKAQPHTTCARNLQIHTTHSHEVAHAADYCRRGRRKAAMIQPNTTHACTSYITALTALPSMTWWRMRLVAARWLSPARRVVAGPVHFDKFSYVPEVRTYVNAEGRSSRNGSRKKYRRFWPLCSCLCVSTSSLLLRCKSLSVSFRTTVHRGQHSAHATCDSAWRHYGL